MDGSGATRCRAGTTRHSANAATEVLRWAFDPASQTPAAARAMAAEMLAGSVHLQSALVLVSELVTNAVLHTDGPAELRILVLESDTVRVEVTDHARDMPRSPPTAGAHGGFGLRIVAALADRWGCTPVPHGKVVWFELGAPPERTSGMSATPDGSRRAQEQARDHRMGETAHG